MVGLRDDYKPAPPSVAAMASDGLHRGFAGKHSDDDGRVGGIEVSAGREMVCGVMHMGGFSWLLPGDNPRARQPQRVSPLKRGIRMLEARGTSGQARECRKIRGLRI